MLIIGCDYHPGLQQIALVDTDTGELSEARLGHREPAEQFYRERKQRGLAVRVGMESSGHSRWFERLLQELGFELWIGDPAAVQSKRVRKQKTDRQDAQLLLRLMREDRFPRIWIPDSANRDLRQLLWHRHRLVHTGLAADKMNFSGRYLREAAEKTTSDSNAESTLEVLQKEDIVEIARVEKGQTMSSRCPLNGSEGDYTSRAGTSGKCKAQLKGNDLLLEWSATTLPPPEPMHGKERWQFSAESKRLTVKSHIYMPKGIHIEMTEKYTRSEKP